MMVELWTRQREMVDDNENDVMNTDRYEESAVQLAWLGWEDLLSVQLHAGSELIPTVSGIGNWLAHEILASPGFSSWFPPPRLISHFLVVNSTITKEHEVKSSLCMSPSHDQVLTPSTANTEFGIHWVQHTLSTAYTTYCIIPRSTVSHSQPVSHLSADHVLLNFLHSHNYKLTNEYSLSSHHTSLPNYRLQIDHLQVLLQSRSIMASKCISRLHRSQPTSVSPFSLDCSLKVCTIMASKCISANSLDCSLQVHIHTRLITASKRISKLTPLRHPSSHDHRLQTRTIATSVCIIWYTRSQCGTTVELTCRQPIIKTPPHLAWHRMGILEKEQFWLK